jgi:hypothetical protein
MQSVIIIPNNIKRPPNLLDLDKEQDWLNQPVWAPIRWFAKLCGCDLDMVRIKIYNNACKIRGGLQWIPYIPSQIGWITPISHPLERMVMNPQKFGLQWIKKNNRWSQLKLIKNQVIHSLWKKRGEAIDILDPPYRDGNSYSNWEPAVS